MDEMGNQQFTKQFIFQGLWSQSVPQTFFCFQSPKGVEVSHYLFTFAGCGHHGKIPPPQPENMWKNLFSHEVKRIFGHLILRHIHQKYLAILRESDLFLDGEWIDVARNQRVEKVTSNVWG